MSAAPKTEEELQGYQKYLLSQGHTPQEVGSWGDHVRSSWGQNNPAEKAIQVAGKLAGIPGNAVRAGTLGVVNSVAQGEPKLKSAMEGLKNIATGNTPSTSQYLEKLGASSMGSLPAWMTEQYRYDPNNVVPPYREQKEVTGRDLLGAAGDAASNFLGAKGVGMAAKSFGKNTFASPFSRQDTALAAEGKPLLSDIMWNRGETPLTKGGIVDSMNNVAGQIGNEKAALEAPIAASDITGDKSYMNRPQEYVDRLAKSGSATDRSLAETLQKRIDAQTQLTPNPTYSDLMDVKRSAWESVPRDKTTTEAKFWNRVGGNAADNSYDIANQVSPGSGAAIKAKNAELSSVLGTLPDAERKALVEATKSPITQVDLMSAAIDPTLFAAKQAGKIAQLPAPWTVGGRAAYGLGTGAEAVAPYSPWLQMLQQQNKGQ